MKLLGQYFVAGAALALALSASAQAKEPSTSYKTPDGTQNCIEQTGAERVGNYVYIYFKNNCERVFSIKYQTRTGKRGGNGIWGLNTSSLTVHVDDFVGFEWWVD